MKGVLTSVVAHVLVSVALLATPDFVHSAEPNADIFGTWKIRKFVGAAEVSSLSQREVNQLIGKKVLISSARFSFNGETCLRPAYERSTVSSSGHFAREWRADANDLAVPNTVTLIETGCNPLYLLGRDRLLIAERGNFFEAVRVQRELDRRKPEKPI